MTVMRTLSKTGREPGLQLVEKPIPTPRADEVLVRVLATSICGTDLHIYNWDAWAEANVRAPLTVGHEFCGEVVAVGEDVIELVPGDYVAAESHVFCGTCYQCRIGHRHICENEEIIGIHRDGAFAEYIAFPERCAWKTDRSVPPHIATLQEPLGNSVHATMLNDVSRKQVVVFGCGPTGLFSVAIAKICGAAQVIAVDVRDFRLDLARRIGADQAIDPSQVDLVARIRELTGGHGADVVLEMSGNARAVEDGLRALGRGGDFRFFGVPSDRLSIDVARDIIFKGARISGIIGRRIYETWFDSSGLLQAGLDLEPIVTHRMPLEEYASAFEMIRDGNCGKIILYPNGEPG
ncbi:MAG: L-threonine 3-dehydrogenase [Planctomycetota bacterium]|jgi:threonine 3-dehydrogenase